MSEPPWTPDEIDQIIVDSSETPVLRPFVAGAQRRVYSGKKKRHTLKTQVVTDEAGEIQEIDAGHRRKIQERRRPLIVERDVRADSGPTRSRVIDISRLPEPPEQRAPAELHPAERLPARNRQERYRLCALWRHRPDLFERVLAGEMSRNAALIQAGIVPSDAEKRRRRLARQE